MFDDADPVLARVRAIALSLPGAMERVSHGRPNFYTSRTFCYYGGSERGDADRVRHDTAILFKPDPDDEPAMRQDPRLWEPAYLWPGGWLGLTIDDDTDWTEVAELIDASFRVTAPRRLVRELDDRSA
jgi:predicted DNA-binding protein (MmcQ/YjbR family)